MAEFSAEDIERGRRYHRPRYLSLLAEFLLGAAALAALAFTALGDALLPDIRWWAQALLYPAIVLVVLTLLRLPLSFWRDHVHERRWGLTTQGPGGWALDAAKGLAVSDVLTALLFLAFVALARGTDAWPLIAAPALGAFVLLLTFVAPVVLEPIFNRFRPLGDDALADDLRALSERAGVPVRDVLVADASRRTTKSNAYVSGFGATRRVVVYDTLLDRAQPDELRAVVAHELAHRRHRDVLWLSAILVGVAVGFVALLWAVVGDDAREPRSFPLVLLVLTLLQPPLTAFVAAIARRWEYRADRFALLLTRDLPALERTFHGLAHANVADLDPPRVVYYLQHTHPTVPERLAALREAARVEGIREEAA